MIGRKISHYEFLERIGEGGMGVVYKARDTSLDRYVAIKALSTLRMADPEARRRFFQEAKLASALNHPNIVTIHEFIQESGVDYIVMEYVSGRTVSDLIYHRALDLKKSLRLAIQLADALSRAHTADIVHRDLKPSNLIVTDQGLLKILDFGLAKLSPASVAVDAETVDLEPVTEEGTIMGTCPYMSPEQAEGRPVDSRSDIFSFGSLLYEMVSGERAFQGGSRISVLGAIVRYDPKPVREIRSDVPVEVERIIIHCMRKEPGKRFQHMADVMTLLEEIKEDSESGRLARIPLRRRQPRWIYAAILALALVAVASSLSIWLANPKPRASASFRPLTRHSGLSAQPALSPDGRMFAYASDHGEEGNLDIWLQQLDDASSLRLTSGPQADCQPVFAASGTKIVYASIGEQGGIYSVPTLGGPARRIAENGAWPSISPDGKQVVFSVGSRFGQSKLYMAGLDGGHPNEFQTNVAWANAPSWSPDGGHILFEGSRDPVPNKREIIDWWLAPANGGEAVQTGLRQFLMDRDIEPLYDPGPGLESRVAWGPDGNTLLIAGVTGGQDEEAGTNMWRVPFSRKEAQPAGQPERLTTSSHQERQPFPDARGRVLFTSMATSRHIWRIPVDPTLGKATGTSVKVTDGAAEYTSPNLWRGGSRLVSASNRSGETNVWLRDLKSGSDTQLTLVQGWEYLPLLSPGGNEVAFCRGHSGRGPLLFLDVASRIERKVLDNVHAPMGWSADGKRFFYIAGEALVLRVVDLASGQTGDFIKHPQYPVRQGAVSPDGRWISFRLVTGRDHTPIFVAPLQGENPPPESAWTRIADGPNDESWWSPDGSLIYFLSRRDGYRCLWSQRLNPTTKRPLEAPQLVQDFHKRLRVVGGLSFGSAAGTDSLYCGLRETTGRIWLMRTSE